MATDIPWKTIWRISRQAVSNISPKENMYFDDLVAAAALAITQHGKLNSAGFNYTIAKRAAIDRWRQLGTSSKRKNGIKFVSEKYMPEILDWDIYPSDEPPPLSPQEVAEKWTSDPRERIIFEILASGGTKDQAAKVIGRHPSRISQILSKYRAKC